MWRDVLFTVVFFTHVPVSSCVPLAHQCIFPLHLAGIVIILKIPVCGNADVSSKVLFSGDGGIHHIKNNADLFCIWNPKDGEWTEWITSDILLVLTLKNLF